MRRLFFLPALMSLCWLLLTAPAGAEPPRGLDAPLDTVAGKTIRLSDYKGKVVLVNFWATWCPPCLAEIPALIKIQNRYRKQGLVVIGIDFMETPDKKRLAKFIKERKINYPIVYGETRKMTALARELGGVFGLPVTKILDRQGKVASTHVGGLTEQKIIAALEPFFGKSNPTK